MSKMINARQASDKRIVAVCSPAPASGVTLTAAALACLYAQEGASFAESGRPYVYDAFGLGRKFLLSGFADLFQYFQDGKAFPAGQNLWHGVHWAVRPGSALPAASGPKTADEWMRFCEKLPGAYTVLDCSGMQSALLKGVLDRADRVVIAVDPMPGKLIPCAAGLQRLRYACPAARLVVTRMNSGVHKSELKAYLGDADPIFVPDVGAHTIYRAEYACVLPWDLPEGRKLLSALKNLA